MPFSRFMLIFGALLLAFLKEINCYKVGESVWCYSCVSTQPGCGEVFDWRWHWAKTCPNGANDRCVKIVERKGADVLITRDCLSSLEGYRRDIPSDRYEGCRPAAKDVKLGHYTFPEIQELDIRREYFDETTFCFCDFDYFCNAALHSTAPIKWTVLLIATVAPALFIMLF